MAMTSCMGVCHRRLSCRISAGCSPVISIRGGQYEGNVRLDTYASIRDEDTVSSDVWLVDLLYMDGN